MVLWEAASIFQKRPDHIHTVILHSYLEAAPHNHSLRGLAQWHLNGNAGGASAAYSPSKFILIVLVLTLRFLRLQVCFCNLSIVYHSELF